MNKQGTKRRGGDAVDEQESSLKQARCILEEEQPAKDDTAELKWRRDPSETYSDWKVEIVHKNNGAKVDVYHVHKGDLACGTRRSDYFHRVFQNGDKFREGSVACSRIELEPLAAAAFPDLLDYCYDPSKSLKIGSDTALALHYLGEYFEVQSLRYDVVQFIKQDLSVENAHLFVEHATIFRNDAMIETIAEFLAKNIQKIGLESDLLEQSNPQLWLKLVGFVDKTDEDDCEWCSFLVSHLSLDTATFQEITTSNNTPHIDADAAISFVESIASFRREHESDATSEAFASLENRCATSLATGGLSRILYEPEYYERAQKTLLTKASTPFLVDALFKTWHELHDCRNKLSAYAD